jgi:hypothetical protein
MAMIAARISADIRCHSEVRVMRSVSPRACAAELPRLAPRPVAVSPVSRGVSGVCVPIANPPSSVRLRPEPLLLKPLRCADNSGLRRGFFVFRLARGRIGCKGSAIRGNAGGVCVGFSDVGRFCSRPYPPSETCGNASRAGVGSDVWRQSFDCSHPGPGPAPDFQFLPCAHSRKNRGLLRRKAG